jgi:uncharacterized membrane protein
MITLGFVYVLAGMTFALFALLGLLDRSNSKRFGNAAFWGLLALSMICGDYLGDFGNGLLVLALVAIAGTGQIGRAPGGEFPPMSRPNAPRSYGPFLLLVALIIPAVALAGTFLFKWVPGLADPKQATLISLALGVLIALAVGMARLKPPPLLPLNRAAACSTRSAGPQSCRRCSPASARSSRSPGSAKSSATSSALQSPRAACSARSLAFGLGMALFTMVMGNAFAAFPGDARRGRHALAHQTI